MSRAQALLTAALPATAGLLAGCLLIAGELQTLTLTFATQRTVARDEVLEVHSAVYPDQVQLRKHFVRLAGRLIVAEGEALPASIDVTAVNEELATGRPLLRFKMTLEIEPDGTFSAVKRYKKDIAAGTLQTVTITPRGAGIRGGSQVTICVDVARSKGDLADRSCPAGASGGEGNLFIVKIVDNAFEPKLLRVEPGDTVRWVLEGSAHDHTTTEMQMRWDSGFAFTQTGATYEWTPTEDHRDQTFGYACVTHQACCQMAASIQVGKNAPEPDNRY